MQVILLEKIRNLGTVGDKVSVKPGYSRNYLIPRGKAVSATPANVAKFEARRVELEKMATEVLAAAQQRATKMSNLTVTMRAKAGDEGKLFGSIGIREIIKAIQAAGHDVQKSEVALPEGAIRKIGEYPITLQLHSDVSVTINLSVLPEAATA
jgi:large subunit ribosomal protein L9